MAQVIFDGNTAPLESALDANFTQLFAALLKTIAGSGTGTATTTIPIGTLSNAAGGGGCLVLLRGAGAVSGAAFVRAYVLSIRVAGGATPDVAQTLIGTAGEAGEVFTFGSSGGFVTVTGSGTLAGNYTGIVLGA